MHSSTAMSAAGALTKVVSSAPRAASQAEASLNLGAVYTALLTRSAEGRDLDSHYLRQWWLQEDAVISILETTVADGNKYQTKH